MNVLNNIKATLKISNGIILNKCTKRFYARYQPLVVENYPVVWKKPEKVVRTHPKRTGDLGCTLVNIKPDDYVVYGDMSKELESADDLIKRIFTLRFHGRRDALYLLKHRITKEVQKHKYDTTSLEVKIGVATVKINYYQKLIHENHSKNYSKFRLHRMINARYRNIISLRNSDYKCYEWLLEKLNMIYRMPLENFEEQVTKKGALRKMTDDFCNKMIQEKLDTYKAELDAQKEDFYKQKWENLTKIKEQELELGLEPTVTEEEIAEAKVQMKSHSKNNEL